jgi:predicted secreted Zn-dependent protease
MEIEDEMGKFGPEIKGSAYRHPGATRMEFSSRIGYRQEDGRCSIVSAQVDIKAKVILPRWKRPRGADAGTKLFWDVFSADIVRHEESHLVIARNHARTLERKLKALRPEKDCDALAKQAEAIKEKVMAEHDRDQQRFDLIEGKSLEKRLLNKLKMEMERRIATD